MFAPAIVEVGETILLSQQFFVCPTNQANLSFLISERKSQIYARYMKNQKNVKTIQGLPMLIFGNYEMHQLANAEHAAGFVRNTFSISLSRNFRSAGDQVSHSASSPSNIGVIVLMLAALKTHNHHLCKHVQQLQCQMNQSNLQTLELQSNHTPEFIVRLLV